MSRLASYIKVKLPESCKECDFFFDDSDYGFMCQGGCMDTFFDYTTKTSRHPKTPQEALDNDLDCAFITSSKAYDVPEDARGCKRLIIPQNTSINTK